ncbi:unnamed protein product, partial [Nesidiocoris tenuis]
MMLLPPRGDPPSPPASPPPELEPELPLLRLKILPKPLPPPPLESPPLLPPCTREAVRSDSKWSPNLSRNWSTCFRRCRRFRLSHFRPEQTHRFNTR